MQRQWWTRRCRGCDEDISVTQGPDRWRVVGANWENMLCWSWSSLWTPKLTIELVNHCCKSSQPSHHISFRHLFLVCLINNASQSLHSVQFVKSLSWCLILTTLLVTEVAVIAKVSISSLCTEYEIVSTMIYIRNLAWSPASESLLSTPSKNNSICLQHIQMEPQSGIWKCHRMLITGIMMQKRF